MTRPMRSCARRPHILRWRSSTAERGDGVVHRRASQGVRGRADLPGSHRTRHQDLPVDLLRRPQPTTVRAGHRDEELKLAIIEIHEKNYSVYGAHKVWMALRRGGTHVARCTVERLMHVLGLRGVLRGPGPRTTVAHPAKDLVGRNLEPLAPNAIWVADFTSARWWGGGTWRSSSMGRLNPRRRAHPRPH